ncbi:MAG TPA: hypothetical protein VGM01_07265, partial [Ktedonobacteraceae bacterium]
MSAKMLPGKNGAAHSEPGDGVHAPRRNEKVSHDAHPRTDRTLEQLWKENELLSQELEARTNENILLNEVISTIGSTLKLDEVLSHVVDTITRATSCHAAFLYLYDPEKDNLALASTGEAYQHHIHKISMALG